MSASRSLALQRAIKRAFDLVAGSILLLTASPIILIAGWLVRRRSPGPMFFAQLRDGYHGEPFTVLKVRTMHVGAEQSVEQTDEWIRYRRIAGDPRVVPGIGEWLRRSSMDELPQLWNVLRGEMSLIGPRPLEVDVLAQCAPEHLALRRMVRPGITGLWQVSGRSEHDIAALCAIDAEYVRRWSLWLDVAILLRTPRAVLSGHGAY